MRSYVKKRDLICVQKNHEREFYNLLMYFVNTGIGPSTNRIEKRKLDLGSQGFQLSITV